MFSFCLSFYVCFCFVLFLFFFWFVCLFVFCLHVLFCCCFFFPFLFPCLCLYVCFLFFVLMTQFYVSRLRSSDTQVYLKSEEKEKKEKKGGFLLCFSNIVYKHTWMILRFFCVQIYVLKKKKKKKKIDLPTLPIFRLNEILPGQRSFNHTRVYFDLGR